LQLPNGQWISKLGRGGPTIIHDNLTCLQGKGGYGGILAIYTRPNDLYKKK
jgi:hypothetical protein